MGPKKTPTPWIRRRHRTTGTTYQVVYWDGGKRVYSGSFRTRTEAVTYKAQLTVSLTAPHPSTHSTVPVDPGNLINAGPQLGVDPFVGRPVKASTLSFYRRTWATFTTWCKGQGLDCGRGAVPPFLKSLASRNRSRATTASYLRVLRTVFGPIPEADRDFKPFRTYRRARPHVFTEEELEALLESVVDLDVEVGRDRHWWSAFLLLLYWTGLRFSEASHLLWQDLDLETGTLTVQSHTRLPGIIDWSPKGKARRTLPVPTVVLVSLRQLPTDTPYVFLTKRRYREVLAEHPAPSILLHGVPQQFGRLKRLAGVREGIIHDFRRTYITNMLSHLQVHEVQILAGHEDVTTTLKHYAWVLEAQVTEKARAVIARNRKNSPGYSTPPTQSDRP